MKVKVLNSGTRYCKWCGTKTELRVVCYTYDTYTGEKIENRERGCSNVDCLDAMGK